MTGINIHFHTVVLLMFSYRCRSWVPVTHKTHFYVIYPVLLCPLNNNHEMSSIMMNKCQIRPESTFLERFSPRRTLNSNQNLCWRNVPCQEADNLATAQILAGGVGKDSVKRLVTGSPKIKRPRTFSLILVFLHVYFWPNMFVIFYEVRDLSQKQFCSISSTDFVTEKWELRGTTETQTAVMYAIFTSMCK